MANEVATKETFSGILTAKLDSVSDALPKDFNKARFVQNALSLVNSKPELAKFGQTQIMANLMKGAFLGLDVMNTEYHLVTFGQNLTFMKDWRGDKKLVKKYSIEPVADVFAEIVREGDYFEKTNVNGKQGFEFKPIPFNSGNVVGAFAYVLYKDGNMTIDVMTLEELENTRKHSKMANTGAWKDYTTEMYKKTVLHRLCKNVTLEFENPIQKDLFIEDVAIETDNEKIVDNEIEENANKVDFDIEVE